MPFTIPSYEDVRDQSLAFFRNRFPGKDSHLESFVGKTARALARLISQFHRSVNSVDNDSVPSKSTSTAGLDRHAFTYGLPTTVAGQYGRKGATTSSGGAGNCTGVNGTVFSDGLLLTASDGVTIVKLSGAVTITVGTSVAAVFVGVTTGTASNLPAGSVLTWQSTPSGADSTVTLSSPLAGATDSESDSDLLARIWGRLQNPPKGGTASDFRTWAEEVSGIFRAYVYPLRGGMDSVQVLVTAAGTGTARKPSTATKEEVDDFIVGDPTEGVEGQRPTAMEGYLTLLPYMPVSSGLVIRLRMTPSIPKFAFDWALGLTTFTVASYAPGVITTNEALPTSLKTAVDLYTNGIAQAPRLQVMSTGAVVPLVVQVTAYNSGAKTLMLGALPAGWVTPTGSDVLYPGGPIVFPIATALLAYIDSLGPSRASGYANVNDSWEDTAAIFRLAEVALDQTSDGIAMAKNCLSGGVTINGSATDVQATDDFNGVQLLYAKSIAVTD